MAQIINDLYSGLGQFMKKSIQITLTMTT